MNTNRVHIDDDEEIDIKEIFAVMYRYRYMILVLVMFFSISSAFYAYFQPNVYKAFSTVEVGLEKSSFGGQDMLAMAMDSGSMNADTEMDIIKSRFLTEKALKGVNLSHHYYTTRRYKEVELYKQSPFEVGMLRGYGASFELIPVDDITYRLIVDESKDIDKNIWSYDEILPYNKEINTTHFHLNIIKTKQMKDEQYRFVIIAPQKIASIVQKEISVNQKSKASSILEISFHDNIPLRAQKFTNALTASYLEQNIEKKTKEATRKLAFIDKQLKFITENLNSSAIKLEDFKKASNTVSLSTKAEAIITRMGAYELQLTEISMEDEMLSALYKELKSGKDFENITTAGLSMVRSEISTMVQELHESIVKKNILLENHTQMYPEVRRLTSTIVGLKKIIVSTVKNMSRSIKDKKALIEQSIVKQQKILNTLPADERMFGQLQRKFMVNEKIYSYLLEKRSETAIIKASTVSKNRIIDTALVPALPIEPKRTLIVLIGFILGLILGLALAFLRDFLDDSIKHEEDISKVLDLPILGLVPHIEKKDQDIIKVFLSPKSAWSESFRNLRTNLQFMGGEKKSNVIAITSTVGGEGKTTMCINLGAIMSMANKKTIILNLDMRKPTLHKKFKLHNTKGMSTLLSGTSELNDAIQHTKYENLDIISSGPIPPNPSELIQSELMEKILLDLREIYDVIIIDTPPVGLVTDARTLMHFADTSIYVLRSEYSKKGFLHSIEKLSKEKISGFGIMLNDIKMSKSGYGYGYGYGYYEEDNK